MSDAFTVSTQIDEQADALIGYFVDQARRSGLSWSQIGGAMGVSKQAAQKRFVPTKAADLFPEGVVKPFSRFTDRAARIARRRGQARRRQAPGRRRAPRGRPAHRAGGRGREGHRRRGRDPGAGLRRRRRRPAPRCRDAGTAELLDLTLDESAKDGAQGAR